MDEISKFIWSKFIFYWSDLVTALIEAEVEILYVPSVVEVTEASQKQVKHIFFFICFSLFL